MESRFELNNDEIKDLFDFVKSKNVPYKDVRCEIVDHLASGIEDMKSENPSLSTEKCLQKIYAKFPITGFGQLQQQKEKALKKMWEKKLFPYLAEYFKLPKIILTAGVFYIIHVFCLYQKAIPDYIIFSTLGILFLAVLILNPILKKTKPRKIIALREEYLFIKSFTSALNIMSYITFLIPFQLYFITAKDVNQDVYLLTGFWSYAFPFFIVSLLITIHLNHTVFPKILEEEVEKKYSHLNLNFT